MNPADVQQLVQGLVEASAADRRPSFVWNHQSNLVLVTQFVAGNRPTKLWKGTAAKSVQAVRIYSARTNLGFCLIGGSSITSLNNGMEQIHAGEGLSLSVEPNDWFDESIDVSQLYAVNSEPMAATLLVTLWTRAKKPI